MFVSRKVFDYNNEPSITHSYDCGAAWENSVLIRFLPMKHYRTRSNPPRPGLRLRPSLAWIQFCNAAAMVYKEGGAVAINCNSDAVFYALALCEAERGRRFPRDLASSGKARTTPRACAW